MTEIYGTLGPACDNEIILRKMFACGMSGVRLNLSHTTLEDSDQCIQRMYHAAKTEHADVRFLIDLQGPELRTGKLKEPMILKDQTEVILGKGGIPIPDHILLYLRKGQRFSIDDGKMLFEVSSDEGIHQAFVLRGGTLLSRKSIAIENVEVNAPVLTSDDLHNLDCAERYGVYGVMQPFVRSGKDVHDVRIALNQRGLDHVRIFAKIENQTGLHCLDEIMEEADEIIIARGDLGNCMPLWKLARVQKEISEKCLSKGKPFMVVTQMLASMEHNPFPTRAEVSDIFHAVTDGASSVMVTGETAGGKYPVEVMKYLCNTVREADAYLKEGSSF